ncbi:MAG: hypothetical protein PHW03_04035 [Eubacteriales bacterium]|nr:hypothetical protein [Eubacteriales bacterium]MDD4389952.1 hypothetical protein [Eubacteriales bacterium]
MDNMYIMFSEAIHFHKIFVGDFSVFPLPMLAITAGILFRLTITTKKGLSIGLAGVFTVWMIGQITCSYVLMNDLIDYIPFSQPFVNFNWLLSTFFVTALVTHLIFRILQKRLLA